MNLWWEKYPGRLEFEIQELRDAGILCEQDKDALAEGTIVLHLSVDVDCHLELKLRVVYPEFYPEFPFEIEAPELTLSHHQNPFSKNLCFLDDPGENWDSVNDTVARFIQDRLPKVLTAGKSNQKNDLESPRSEPFSNFISFSQDSIIFIDSAWTIDPNVSSGRLQIGLNRQPSRELFRGSILAVQDKDNNLLANSAAEIAQIFPQKILGRWVRFDQPPTSNNVNEIFAEAVSRDKRVGGKPLNNKFNVDVTGILFPEETKWREVGDGWMFIVRTFDKGKVYSLLVRAGRAGKQDLQGRNPSLRGLESKGIAVFGLGCLGAPSAIEFARCGIGELHLLDCDYVEPGTTVRWPYGLTTAAGREKSPLLANVINHDYPFTKVDQISWRLGRAQWPLNDNRGPTEWEICSKMLDGIDLLYDATAELPVSRVLSALAAERGIPYVHVSGTPGMWGGRIIRILPGENRACWTCYRHAITDEIIPVPASDELNGTIAPEGCGAPTFTGTNFDALQVAMAGVRMVVSTLMEGIAGGYPSIDWDVAVINLRDESGAVIPPMWSTHKLAKLGKCHCNLK